MNAKKLQAFADLIRNDTVDHTKKTYPNINATYREQKAKVTIRPGKKYTKVDIGTSGKFMS